MSPDHLAWVLTGRAAWPSDAQDWASLISQARRANLAARMKQAVDAAGVSPPSAICWQLEGAAKAQRQRARAMALESRRVIQALRGSGVDGVLLKGAAYLVADLPAATARQFGDIDILVAEADLVAAEAALMGGGWISLGVQAYDRRYYREWMHEIPPLTHISRGSVVDMHHTIVPPTSAFRVDGAKLLGAARTVAHDQQLRVLQPVDMVLHSMVHLFTDGEFENGLRDLLDLWDLLRHFERLNPAFWDELFQRADSLGLGRPLHHALDHLERLAGPMVPSHLRGHLRRLQPSAPTRLVMRMLLAVALRPMHPACRTTGDGFARWLLYVRSHWLRMPLRLLLPHLIRKAWMRRFGPSSEVSTPAATTVKPPEPGR